MKLSSKLIISGTTALATTLIIANLWHTSTESNVSNQALLSDGLLTNSANAKATLLEQANKALISSSKPKLADNSISTIKKLDTDEELLAIDESIFEENQALRETFRQIASQYADNIRFPLNSQPVRSLEEVRGFKPFEQASVSTPFPEGDNDENPIRINAATDTFQYFVGDTINIQVTILNSPSDAFISVEGVLSGANGEINISTPFTEDNQSNNTFTTSIDTKQLNSALLSPEMVVKLNVVVGNRDLDTTIPFLYNQAAAQISGVQQARPEGSELVIPVELDVFENGYYFVRGVLVDATNGRPLIQLQAESRLLTGRATVDFRAHISALQAQQSEGPYLLQNISGYRGAEVGEALDTPASVTQQQFSVDGFPFSDYDNEEFVDELAQERLEFLNNFGVSDDSQ